MKLGMIPRVVSILALATLASAAQQPQAPKGPPAAAEIPHLKKQGTAAQMIVDGKPFLMLAGELHNSSSSSLEYMKPIWKKLVALNLNTVIGTVSWELLEPQEGKFDFGLVDGLIHDARASGLRLVLIWFGSWKNGVSSYAPVWVKTDLQRFPRAQRRDGINLEVLSPAGEASLKADAAAFAALMRHIRAVDQQHTVVMMQVENEAGLLGDSRDRSPVAEAAWNKPVPAALMNYLGENKDKLLSELAEVWRAAGGKTSGTWAEVFGDNPQGDEVFMAWHIGRYVGKVAEAGKAEYGLPMYANAWLVQHEGQEPGGYPSGGPVSHMMDVWRAAAPKIDLFAPDIYLPDFKGVTASYTRSGNPLFIPEARLDPVSAVNVFWAVGSHSAMGFSPFGIDNIDAESPLGASYKALADIAPAILKAQGTGNMIGVLQDAEQSETASLNGYKLRIDFRAGRQLQPAGRKAFGLIVATGPDEFLAAGSGFSVSFTADSPGPKIARIAYIDEGRYVNGKWTPGRRMNGDENGGGTRLQLPWTGIGIQRIKLYRHD
jgi:hypothetical protein